MTTQTRNTHSYGCDDTHRSANSGGSVPLVGRDAFISAMRKAASSVCIVATAGPSGQFGVTVSAMTSVTADPPAVLACVNNENLVLPAIAGNQSFCVSVLCEEHKQIADVFAGRHPTSNSDRFACAEWIRLTTGSPALIGAVAVFDCYLAQQHQFGSHTLVIGTVAETELNHGRTLVYHDRNYFQLVQ